MGPEVSVRVPLAGVAASAGNNTGMPQSSPRASRRESPFMAHLSSCAAGGLKVPARSRLVTRATGQASLGRRPADYIRGNTGLQIWGNPICRGLPALTFLQHPALVARADLLHLRFDPGLDFLAHVLGLQAVGIHRFAHPHLYRAGILQEGVAPPEVPRVVRHRDYGSAGPFR